VSRELEAPHLRLRLAQSDRIVAPGNRLTLVAEVELPPAVHVYAPEVRGYKPVQLAIEPSPELILDRVVYPPPKVLYLEAIRERVPVFEGKLRIVQDVTVTRAPDFVRSLGSGKTITIGGELHYQACDQKVCYPPAAVPVKWQLNVMPLDRQRSPEGIQHK
jgi:DsbC/DsbD-like thiol-disulfide interchange protein